jgi:CRISPR-associated protein Csm2
MRDNVSQRGDDIIEELSEKIAQYASEGLSKLPGDVLVDIAERLGKYLKDRGLKMAQIRRFFDAVRKLDVQFNRGKNRGEDFSKDKVVLLKPKLAYAVGRNKEVWPLWKVVDPAITGASKSYDDFKQLLWLIEAIVAYHKFYGGEE